MLFRFLAILIVAGGVLGGSAYFAYELFWKPKALDEKERQEIAVQKALPPPPHPGIAKFQAAAGLLKAGKPVEGRAAMEALVTEHPDAPDVAEAYRVLGEMNAAELFSPLEGPGKTPYTVIKGDALAKIANKTKTSAELIYAVNQLQTINLKIGQILQIPTLDIKISVDRASKTLTVTNLGKFFKSYPLLGATVPRLAEGATLESTVGEKIVAIEGKRIAFGDKTYFDAERSILLTPGGATLRSATGTEETVPPGIVMSPTDLREVFVLVTRGTPISIR
jgi:hypothetical protein